MRSTACLQNVPAPSSTLLRFLRSQSESLWFFSQNPSFVSPPLQHTPFSPGARRNASASLLPSSSSDSIGANLINLDFLFPRAKHNSQRSRKLPYWNRNLNSIAIGLRHASTEKKGWLKAFWPTSPKGKRTRQGERAPYDSPSDTEMLIPGRSLLTKQINEPRLRCTELDEYGKVVLASGEFKKTELIARVQAAVPSFFETMLTAFDSTDFYLEICARLTRLYSLTFLFDRLRF